VEVMEHDKEAAERHIPRGRDSEHAIEDAYIERMTEILSSSDTSKAMKEREIYHHLKDAGRNLSITLDILHRIIVGLS